MLSTVHGAVETGWRKADRILNSLDGSRINHSRVLIVGAGASGVAAASRLLENGVLDVTILEAENRLGGRIHTIPFGDDVVDLGAQWVHGEVGNVVYEMANPLKLLSKHTDTWSYFDDLSYFKGNGEELDSSVMEQLMNITDRIRDDVEGSSKYNGSFKQYHDEKFADLSSNISRMLGPLLVNSYLTWIEKVWSFSDATENWNDLSAKGFGSYMECPGDQLLNWVNNGYSSVINLLTKKYPNPEQELPVRNKTHFCTEVKTIYWGPNKVMGPSGEKVVLVETSDGSKFTAEVVLVTVSLGVLKERAQTMFNPPLPERKLNAIQHIGFGQVDKILLYFNESWWPTNKTAVAVIPTNDDRLQFNSLYPQYLEKGEWTDGLTGFFSLPMQPGHVLIDWIVGRPARNMEKYSDEEVRDACLRWLEMSLNQTVPQPVSVVRSKWHSNPHFRGSYSYESIDAETHGAQHSHLAEPLSASNIAYTILDVLFAGEATNHKQHFSTVHGAIESGWREADRILVSFGLKNETLSA